MRPRKPPLHFDYEDVIFRADFREAVRVRQRTGVLPERCFDVRGGDRSSIPLAPNQAICQLLSKRRRGHGRGGRRGHARARA